MSNSNFKPVAEQLAYLKKGVAEIIPEAELTAKLEKSLKTGKPLRVYLGVDPTAPDIHLGHTVVLRKLKHFQDLGHTAIFLVGDFSAMIGDPTGQSETRPPLTREQVDANAKTYLQQVFKILDKEKTEVRYNSEWLDKLSSYEIVRLCGRYRLARMLEREDFRSRLTNNQPISVHELLYPLLTAWDAVMLESDVEIGATEQKFNLLVHRDIQIAVHREKAVQRQLESPEINVEYERRAQVCFTMPILVGLDGQRKMSKSLNNYIGITEAPGEMFGKIMSISDDLMWTYIDLLTNKSVLALQDNVRRGTMHPFAVKSDLAESIVRDFHGPDAALQAATEFRAKFSERQVPESIREIKLKRFYDGTFRAVDEKEQREIGSLPAPLLGKEKWIRVLAALKETESASEAERLIKGGGFEVNGEIIRDPSYKLDLTRYGAYVVRIGKKKRYFRLVLVVE
jgi:tyrosyl-tRNA synthetase